ncbi:transposase family protein [Streptomyces sp. NPDC029006]|uniref:transposase family protein n=1 Tax=Streptomyces sp. NPDC029006 TaxID=3155467 RepID=UPI0033FE0B11
MLVYPSGIDLSNSTLRYLSDLLRARRRERGTRWRRLTADRQALLALAHLCCGHTYAQLAAGFGIGLATVYRYVVEAVEVLAALAPTLQQAMTVAANKAFVILDGTLLHIDRIAADRPYYSGKRKRHGMNVQVIADAFGRLLWASPALPGAVHDIKAARTHGIIEALTQAGIRDVGRQGISGSPGTIRVPHRGRWSTLPAGKRAVNSSHARIRAVGEQANAILKSWRLLRKLRCSTTRITDIVKAVLALHLATAA